MAFETVRRFLDGVYYNQDDMANSFNGVFGNLNNITANVSGLNVVLSGGYVLLNGYFINFVGVDTVAVTANASGYIYVSYDFSDDTYSISYAATIPADSDTIKNLGIYSTVSTASAVTLTKINNNDSMFAIINSAIAKINADILAVNTDLGYKFDLGKTLGVQNVQNAVGGITIDSEDLNNIKYTGSYYCYSPANSPLGQNGYLEVHSLSVSYVYQRFIPVGGLTEWTRQLSNGTWQPWRLSKGQQLLTGGGSHLISGATIDLTLSSIVTYGKLRMEVLRISDGTVLGTVDLPIDQKVQNGATRTAVGGGNLVGETSLVTVIVSLLFNTSNVSIRRVKQTSISVTNTSAVGQNTECCVGAIYGLPY